MTSTNEKGAKSMKSLNTNQSVNQSHFNTIQVGVKSEVCLYRDQRRVFVWQTIITRLNGPQIRLLRQVRISETSL